MITNQNLPDEHPAKQGLKLIMTKQCCINALILPDEHPAKQGLKHLI